jgi:hypothetical protein
MNCAGLPSVQKQLGFSTRRKFVEVVTAITVGAGMTPNAMAFGQGALHHPDLEASRFGRFPHGVSATGMTVIWAPTRARAIGVITAFSAAGVWASVLVSLGTTTDIARRHIPPAMYTGGDGMHAD